MLWISYELINSLFYKSELARFWVARSGLIIGIEMILSWMSPGASTSPWKLWSTHSRYCHHQARLAGLGLAVDQGCRDENGGHQPKCHRCRSRRVASRHVTSRANADNGQRNLPGKPHDVKGPYCLSIRSFARSKKSPSVNTLLSMERSKKVPPLVPLNNLIS